jgi:hypothetical protein
METGIILIYGVDSVNNHNLDSENKTEHDKWEEQKSGSLEICTWKQINNT